MGPDLVPDYLTNVPVGAQYGWPWVYWKDKFDRRVEAPIPAYLSEYARRPEYALGPHVAALGLVFTKQGHLRSEEHTSELPSLMRISYAVFCLKQKKQQTVLHHQSHPQ